MSIDAGAQVAIFFTRMWTRCGRCKMLGQVVPRVELPVQRILCPIFIKSRVLKKGTQWSGVGLPDIHEYSAIDGLSTDPRDRGITFQYHSSMLLVFRCHSNQIAISHLRHTLHIQ